MGDDVTEAAEKAAEAAPVDVMAEEMEQVGNWIADLIRAAEGIVVLNPEQWDTVIHVLEDHHEQVAPPYDDDVVSPGVQEQLEGEAERVGEIIDALHEQVGDDGE